MKKLILLLNVLFSCALNALVIESKHITDVLRYIDDESALIVFDIDNTLAELECELGSDQWFYAMVQQQVKQGIDAHDAIKDILPLYLSLQLVGALQPVEEVAPFLVKDLQRQQYKVIALTARSLSLVRRTFEQLDAIDIDFSTSGLSNEEIDLKLDFPCVHKDGIVFSSNNNKGKVLLAFLDYVGYHPRKVIFIDDKIKNINTVREAVESRGIEFVGIRYGRLDEKVAQFDLEKTNTDLENFFETGCLQGVFPNSFLKMSPNTPLSQRT